MPRDLSQDELFQLSIVSGVNSVNVRYLASLEAGQELAEGVVTTAPGAISGYEVKPASNTSWGYVLTLTLAQPLDGEPDYDRVIEQVRSLLQLKHIVPGICRG